MAFALIRQQDPGELNQFLDDERFNSALVQDGGARLEPIAVPHVVGDMLLKIRALLRLKEMQQSGGITRALEKVSRECLEMAQKYGRSLAMAYKASRDFTYSPDFVDTENQHSNTLANFDKVEAEIHRIREIAYEIYNEAVAAVGEEDSVARYIEGVLDEVSNVTELKGKLLAVRDRIYTDPDVRLAMKAREHAHNSRKINSGANVIETPTVINILNGIHAKVYGRKPLDAVGMALSGPPGLGKTAILTHYIKTYLGVEPISIDIDEGQSAMTLMVRPRLAEADPAEPHLKTIRQLDDLGLEDLKAIAEKGGSRLKVAAGIEDGDLHDEVILRRKLSALPRELLVQQLASSLTETHKGPYTYGAIYEAMEKNVPVILNEVQWLRNPDFLHSLLTAIPASDADADPMPSYKPNRDGLNGHERKVKGWFFSTITSKWVRVRENFRVFFTGNIGSEFGNQGLPPALVSRLKDRFMEMPSLPQNELVDIAWAGVSDNDGRCVLSEAEAKQLYYLLTEIVPEMDKQAREAQFGSRKIYFSMRTIEALGYALNPKGRPKSETTKQSLKEALYTVFVKNAKANDLTDSIRSVVVILAAAGYFDAEMLRRVQHEIPAIQTDEIAALIAQPEYKGLAGKVNPDKTQANSYEDACVVCSINCCPAHSGIINEHLGDVELRDNLLKVNLDKEVIGLFVEKQKALAERKQWHYFLQNHVRAISEGAGLRLVDILSNDELGEFTAFVSEQLTSGLFQKPENPSPQRCLDDLAVFETIADMGLCDDVLEDQRSRVTEYLRLMAEKHFADYREDAEDDGEEKALPNLSNDALRTMKAIDTAKRLGFDVSLEEFNGLGRVVRKDIGRRRSELTKTQKKRLGNTTTIKNPFEYIRFVGVAHRLFRDEKMAQYLQEKHFTPEVTDAIFTVLSVGFGDKESPAGVDIIHEGLNLEPELGPKKGSHVMRSEADFDLGLAGEFVTRAKLIDVLRDWRDTVLAVDPGLEANFTKHISSLLATQSQWLAGKVSAVARDDFSVEYLKFSEELARVHGIEVANLIERVMQPKVVEAPPLRAY